ncbi:hypothetical protein GCM10020255_024780 [Rhodococcus baikonurensis]
MPSGSLFGLVGPNGAGKTTTLSMAVGLLRPHYGRSLVYGYDVWNDPVAAKSLLGVLPDGLALPAQFTGHELLTYFGDCAACQRTSSRHDATNCWPRSISPMQVERSSPIIQRA